MVASSPKAKTRVFIVDDHPIVRQGLVQLVNNEADLTVCGEAPDAGQALELLPKLKPDFLVVDISLNGMNGIELIKTIRMHRKKLPILVVSMHDELLYAERALRAGAGGYIMKDESPEQMIQAIRRVLKGHVYVSETLSSRFLHGIVSGEPITRGSALERLSDRELEIFRFLGEGLGTRQIAEKLCLSIKTIESYCAHIKEKMMFQNGRELLKQAIQWVESEKLKTS